MTGEFFFNDAWRPGALVFFAAATVALAWHYVPLGFRKILTLLARWEAAWFSVRRCVSSNLTSVTTVSRARLVGKIN
jgi:hypothetical protein